MLGLRYVNFMPKEFIHFVVARRTAHKLKNTPLGLDAKTHAAALLIGAVFHDVWFYMTGHCPGRLKELPDELHGKDGQDTYWLIREQAIVARKKRGSKISGTASSLLVGMVSHLCADVIMHPMVYYFSGNYYSDPLAVEQHRRLESLMDMAVILHEKEIGTIRLSELLKTMSLDNAYPLKALAKHTKVSPHTLKNKLTKSFNLLATVQGHIPKPSLGLIAFGLLRFMPQKVRNFLALFYSPQLEKHIALVQGVLRYRHPVTGKEMEATLDKLMDQAASMAAELLRRLEPFVLGKRGLDLSKHGPSLDTGLPFVSVDQAIHFAPRPLPPYP